MKNNSEIQNEKLTQFYVIYVWNNPVNIMSTDINTKLGIFSTYSSVQSSVCLYSGDIEKKTEIFQNYPS